MTGQSAQAYESPIAVDLPRSDVSAIADTVRKKVGYSPGNPLDEVVKKLGGELGYDDALEVPGAIVIEPGRFYISLSRHTNTASGRFTVAHEIGHYILHYLYQNQRNGKNIRYLRAFHEAGDQAEVEADWFAAGFLMPAPLFREQHQRLGKDLFALADHFGVTVQAAQSRAESLNLR